MPATATTVYPTGSGLRSVIWTRRSTLERPILWKVNTSLRMSTRGVSPTECNMFNNVSYRQFTVNGGPTNVTFSPVDYTMQMQPALMAWAGATVDLAAPD